VDWIQDRVLVAKFCVDGNVSLGSLKRQENTGLTAINNFPGRQLLHVVSYLLKIQGHVVLPVPWRRIRGAA
jgi:hypothetical protein